MTEAPRLRRVIYVSHDVGHTLPEAESDRRAMLDDILAAARRNNARAGVTGALLYSARRFAQVLEGPPAAVEAIFERIQCDPRHGNIAVLDVAAPATRAFAAWSMALADAPQVTPEDFDTPDAADRLLSILRTAIRNTEAASA